MANNTLRTHLHRTRRLVTVAATVATLAGFGAVALSTGGSASATSTQSCAPTVGTPTATTTHTPTAQLVAVTICSPR